MAECRLGDGRLTLRMTNSRWISWSLATCNSGQTFFLYFIIMVTVRDVNTCLVCVVQLSWHFVRGHSTVYSVETVVAKCSCIRFTSKSVPYVAIPTCRISPSRSLFWNVQKCHRLTTAIAPDYKSRDGFMRDDFLHSVMLHDRSDIRCQNFFLVLLCVITECVCDHSLLKGCFLFPSAV